MCGVITQHNKYVYEVKVKKRDGNRDEMRKKQLYLVYVYKRSL